MPVDDRTLREGLTMLDDDQEFLDILPEGMLPEPAAGGKITLTLAQMLVIRRRYLRQGYAEALKDSGPKPVNDTMAEQFRGFYRVKALLKYPKPV